MAVVNVTSVNILNNPSPFSEPFQFEIQYECLAALEHGKSHVMPCNISDVCTTDVQSVVSILHLNGLLTLLFRITFSSFRLPDNLPCAFVRYIASA